MEDRIGTVKMYEDINELLLTISDFEIKEPYCRKPSNVVQTVFKENIRISAPDDSQIIQKYLNQCTTPIWTQSGETMTAPCISDVPNMVKHKNPRWAAKSVLKPMREVDTGT